MNIDGKTKIIGIFGWPLSYTRSPIFQNAGLAAAGLNAVYLPFPIEAENFPGLWKSLSKLPNFLGANVTNPHKQAALRLADRLTPEAKAIGAVNTLYRNGKYWVGHNTDAAGFLAALGRKPVGKKALLLGAGGAARAVAYALWKAGAARVTVACRRQEQGRSLIQSFKASSSRATLKVLGREPLASLVADADFVVNTVPDLAFSARLGALRPANSGQRFFECSYVSATKARRSDALKMLLEQGCLSFSCWTGKKAPKAEMRKALGH